MDFKVQKALALTSGFNGYSVVVEGLADLAFKATPDVGVYEGGLLLVFLTLKPFADAFKMDIFD